MNVDAAILGSVRERSVVRLASDGPIAKWAALGATLVQKIRNTTAEFEEVQARLRQYGLEKTRAYNSAYKTDISTVSIPYEVEGETRHVQVVCQNKYSVSKDMILNNRDRLGSWMEKLFRVDRQRKLRPEGEVTIRKILGELGLSSEEVESEMSRMFETEVRILVSDDYESARAAAPPDVAEMLDHAVVRQNPSIRY